MTITPAGMTAEWQTTPPALGTPSSLAEGAWMGSPQATDFLEQARPRPATVRRGSLFTRELSVPAATFLLAAAFLVSAMLGAIRQVLFNAQFGAGSEASAYYAAFRLPDTLFSLIAGGALSSALIPVLLSHERERGEAAVLRLVQLVMTALLVVFAVVVVAGELLAPLFVRTILAPGFDAETSALATRLTRIMLLQPAILAAGSVAIAVLNSRNQFVLTSISVLAHNVSLIGGILAARTWPELGVYGPALGVVGGGVLQALILLPALFARAGRPRFAWAPGDAGLREVVRLLVPNGLAVGVGYAGFIVDTAFASNAAEPEALAAILNAWLLVGLPIALLGQAVGQAAFPRLAARAAAGDFAALRRTLLTALSAVALLALPAMAAFAFTGRDTIRILFEHGEFGDSAGDLTAKVLFVYAVALPAYVATEVITRALIALRDTRSPLISNTVQLAARAIIIAVLLDSRGVLAIPIAFAVTAAVETVALGIVLAWRLRAGRLRAELRPLAEGAGP